MDESTQTANPQRSILASGQRGDRVRGEIVMVSAENDELVAVKAG